MEQVRKPFQGIINIIRFNWHLFVIAFSLVLALLYFARQFEKPYSTYLYVSGILIFCSITISLVTSFYIYDYAGLYRLNWIEQNNKESLIVNITAGFDETSYILQNKFKNAEIIVLDFYNPEKNTEVSIKRARQAYPAFPKTKQIELTNTELIDNSADKIFVILSAHEIRNELERTEFFKELNRILKPNGQIYVTEHLKDLPNFLAYTIGFFHFHTKSSWFKSFNKANLKLKKEIKLTPFISTFILNKNGNTH